MLNHKTAVLTGASRGLGRQIAHRLAQAGMHVALCARNEADLQAVATDVVAQGGSASVHVLDVRNTHAIHQIVQAIKAERGAIDVLINNAGLSWYKPLVEWTTEEVETVLLVNLNGLIHMTHAVLPHMIERQSGQIINIASDIGRRVVPNMAPYVAAKHGVVGFSGSLLREVKDQGIRVSVLLPGIIDTYFGGAEEGSRDPSWAMHPKDVADVIHTMLTQPRNIILDEVTVHPLGQDF